MWLRHWSLDRDPFSRGPGTPFVATATHSEALARLLHVVENGERRVDLRGSAGLGKSCVLAEALSSLRRPGRRIALARGPGSTADLLQGLSEGLAVRWDLAKGLEAAWQALARSVRLSRLQGQGVVLAVDDDRFLDHPAGRRDLDRLSHLDPHPGAKVSVILAGRPIESVPDDGEDWSLSLRLSPLTCTEAEQYLSARLAAAGRAEPAFTPRAVVRLQSLAGGVPRGLDRLAGLALRAAALRGLEIVSPEIIEGAEQECLSPGRVWQNTG